MKRVVAALALALLGVVGASLLLAAAWFTVFIGTDGSALTTLGSVTSTSQARAIVVDVDRVEVDGIMPGVGRVFVVARSPGDSPLAMVEADAGVADRQLAGVAYDAATRDGATWRMAPVPGGDIAPTWDTTTWPSVSVGTRASLPVTDGSVIVIGNADATPGVAADLALEWRMEHADRALGGFVAAGVLLVVTATVGGWLILRRR